MKKVENIIINIKKEFNIPPHLPIKWNVLDNTIKDVYVKEFQDNAEYVLSQLKANAKFLRIKLFEELSKTNIKIIFSITKSFGGFTNKFYLKTLRMMMTQMLQRSAIEDRVLINNIDKISSVVLDWEGKTPKGDIFEVFNLAYYKGQGYYGEIFNNGTLRSAPFHFPYLSYSSTSYNPFLQVADMFTGCLKDLFKYIIDNKPLTEEMLGYLSLIYGKIRRDGNGNIWQCGFIVQPQELLDIIKKRAPNYALN